MNRYIPEVGPKVIRAHVEETVVSGILNRPAPGTRLRVTLPGTETAFVGVVTDRVPSYELIEVGFEGAQGPVTSEVSLWLSAGWEFEFLPPISEGVESFEFSLVNELGVRP